MDATFQWGGMLYDCRSSDVFKCLNICQVFCQSCLMSESLRGPPSTPGSMNSPTDTTMEDEITRLRNEVASLKQQLAASTSSDMPMSDNDYGNEGGCDDFEGSNFLNEEALKKFNDPSSVNPSSLDPPAASAAADKNQNKMEGSNNSSAAAELNASEMEVSNNSSAGNDASSLVPPAASAAAASAAADKNQNTMEWSNNFSAAAELNASHLASVVAKVVISDGKMSSVDPTSEGTRLLQYCLNYADRFKCFSSSSSSSKVLMCVCLSALSPFEYHSITGEMIMENCCVTCVGFESPSLGTFGAHLTQTATHCIVGLPPVLDAPGPGAEVENILVHPHPLRSNEVAAVSSMQFWRLATPGKWVPSEIMDWYASFLSVNQQSDVKFFGCDFFSVAIRPHDDEEKFQRKLKIDSCTARNVFPCFFHNHWTLTTFEASTARTPRLCFMDSLDLFEHEITEKFLKLFGLTSSFNTNVNLCHLNGGSQSEDPLTECGIFTMQNMEAFMKSKPFFKIGEWESAARQRTSTGCKVSRNEYAALLREHSVHYLRLNFPAGIPVLLGPRKLDILPQVKQPPPEVVVLSEDSDDSGRKRKSKQKEKSTTQKRIAEQVPQPQQKREEDEMKTKMPPPPAAQGPTLPPKQLKQPKKPLLTLQQQLDALQQNQQQAYEQQQQLVLQQLLRPNEVPAGNQLPQQQPSHQHSTRTKSTITVPYCASCQQKLGSSASCQACWDSLDPRKQRSDLFRRVDEVLQARDLINRFSLLNYSQVCYEEAITKPKSLNKYKGFRYFFCFFCKRRICSICFQVTVFVVPRPTVRRQ